MIINEVNSPMKPFCWADLLHVWKNGRTLKPAKRQEQETGTVKIRLMGSPDLVQKWGKELENTYGITGKIYPNRNSYEVRYYVDLDDRKAEEVIKRQRLSNNHQIKKVVK